MIFQERRDTTWEWRSAMYSCTTPWHWYAHASAAKFRKAAQLSPFIYINAEFPLGAHSVPLKASTGRCKRSSSRGYRRSLPTESLFRGAGHAGCIVCSVLSHAPCRCACATTNEKIAYQRAHITTLVDCIVRNMFRVGGSV